MNKERRKRLELIVSNMQDILSELEDIRFDEQVAYDNMPESFQQTERGEQIQVNADDLSDAYDNLDSVIETIEEILDNNQ